MEISAKTRKILWARSGNFCAICKRELIINATPTDDDSIIAEECHIISSKTNGPRYDPAFPQEQIDEYSNLVILCRIHHKMIDDQKETYTADALRKIKIDHERWYKEKLSQSKAPSSPKLKRLKDNIPSFLQRLSTGREVQNIVCGACASSTDYDELETQEEVELVGRFFSWVQDLDVLNLDSDLALSVQTGFELTGMITELEEAGFFVFGAREIQLLDGGVGEPANFPVAIFRVLRKTNPEIRSVSIDSIDGKV